MTVRTLVAAGLLFLATGVGVGTALKSLIGKEISPVGVGAKAPDFVAVTVAEPPKEKTLAAYRGNVVLLNIWATWCGPCRIEMPSIEQLHRAYAPKGLKVVAISVDDPGMAPQIRSFVQEYGLTFEVLHDPQGPQGTVSRNYQTMGYPETIIIGRDGTIRRKLLGAHDWNSANNRALIEQLLTEETE
ncbi:MAG TPA: TlpA family protein disulfide reductase [Gemmatimonadaceae bacterium]|nr:TlpA family protein disulfide reductase [Gemmatimonadaceae bacterium]